MGVQANKKRKRTKKPSEDDRVEELEREVRELKALNRSLMKQLKKLSKGINRLEYEQALERLDDEQKETPRGHLGNERKCPECNAKEVIKFELAGRKFERCDVCGYKSGKLNS